MTSSSLSSLAQRTRSFGETIFSEITSLAQAHGAVNLGQGFPDFAPPDFVLQAARAALDRGPLAHQYARGSGSTELTEMLARQMETSFGRAIDPMTEITITVGATEGLFASALALINPGDEVVLFEPFYDAYPADTHICEGIPRFVPLLPDGRGGWGFDPDDLRGAFSSRTKLIILNTPHNPTGKVFNRQELEIIADLCVEHDALAVCDEVYEWILFDDLPHLRLATIDGMQDRTVTISSAGKTFSVTGWKIGWVIARPQLTAGIRKMHQWIPFAVTTPLQLAVCQALGQAQQLDYYPWLRQMYQAKRDMLALILRRAGLDPYVPQGTYFIVADTSAMDIDDDLEFCRFLTTDVGVAAIPTSPFYSEAHRHLARHHARFCFCKEDETLQAAAERLSKRSLGL